MFSENYVSRKACDRQDKLNTKKGGWEVLGEVLPW